MRPRPAKDEDVRPEDPEQVGGVRNGVKLIGLEHRGDEGRQSRAATTTEWSTISMKDAARQMPVQTQANKGLNRWGRA